MAYLPIENHGIIGNMRTAALVGTDGSIDWLCLPRFDSASVFAALLDDTEGGRFSVGPARPAATSKQYYLPDTNVLVTRFPTADGAGEIADFMTMKRADREAERLLVRCVRATRGSFAFQVNCRPAFNYGRESHHAEIRPEGAIFHSPSLTLGLSTPVPLSLDGDGVVAEFTLPEGQSQSFLLYAMQSGESLRAPLAEAEVRDLVEQTAEYWRRWIAKCDYVGRWREMVHRSALALELMVYEPTGAVVAAPTTSLPEHIGGERNWDYRCSWIRDSAFTVYALLRVGLADEADRFMSWVESRCNEIEPNGSLQTLYGIGGQRELKEETLDHWEGYRGSRPVRVGNAAYDQLQMDIYGELMDAVYLYNKYGSPISSELWRDLRRLVDWVSDNWQQPDNGIWEVRSERQHFVYSKLMCWVALDRALRLANQRSFLADRDRWTKARDQIYEELLAKGWSDQRGAFVQHYGSMSLDASSLIMPLVFFMAPNDPKMIGTVNAVCQPVAQGGLLSDGSVYRYNLKESTDGLRGSEGTFNMCGFWLVEALTRAGRTDPARLEQARLLFEKMLGQANHLGLYSEESGSCGEALGNFPQAFAHLALISAAINLDRALEEGRARRGS